MLYFFQDSAQGFLWLTCELVSWSSLFCQNLSWSSGSCTWVWNWDTMCDHELREENKKVRNKFPKESVKKMEFTSWLNSFNLLSWWWSWCSLPLSWIHESPHASSSLLSFYIFNLKEFMIRGDTREKMVLQPKLIIYPSCCSFLLLLLNRIKVGCFCDLFCILCVQNKQTV